MPQYSKGQLESIWSQVNPGLGNPKLMAAISLAESGGNSASKGSLGDCGLWQIYPPEPNCYDPATNARQAGDKLRTQGLGAWTTYKTGAYQQFYTPTKAGEKGAGVLSEPGGVGVAFNKKKEEERLNKEAGKNPPEQETGTEAGSLGIGALAEQFKSFAEFFKLLVTPAGWIRIGKVVVGGTIILIVIMELAKIGAGSETKPVTGKIGSAAKEVGIGATEGALVAAGG